MAGGTFPTSLPTYTITAGAETANGAAGGTGLSGLLNQFEVDVTALATKLGSGAATPTANKVLVGNGVGTSTWSTTLAGLTLTAPAITTPTITTPQVTGSINDSNNNEVIRITATGSAVNDVTIINAATGNGTQINASGDDTNVDLLMSGKGNGVAFAKNSELYADFVVSSTGTIAISSGLIGTFANITYYIGGQRYKKSSIANKTYAASSDTYVDIDTSGTVTYVAVANGATTGMGLTANSVRVAKVVTSGAAITSIQQNGIDPLGNQIKPFGSANSLTLTPVSYAPNTELLTGEIWVDGRPVYRKVIRGTVNIAVGVNNVAHGIASMTAAWELLRANVSLKLSSATNASGQETVIHRESGGNWGHVTDIDQTNVAITSSFAWGNSWCTILMEYVK